MQDMQLSISGNENGFESLNIYTKLNDKNVELFRFDYSEGRSLNNIIPDSYKTMKIGTVNLYQTLENKELREKELNRVMNKLEELYDKRNPYSSRRGVYGGPSQYWRHQHSLEIAKYENLFTELDAKNELIEEDKREIEITNRVYNLLLEDYGLTDKSFYEVVDKSESNLQKKLIKRQSNLTIVTDIKYV